MIIVVYKNKLLAGLQGGVAAPAYFIANSPSQRPANHICYGVLNYEGGIGMGCYGENVSPVGGANCGYGSPFTSSAAILVLFILLVIITKAFWV
ncbi:hypothetical protein D3C73_1125990 [compost metagenome]